ncbi:hypothetical protein Droror1_Dr00027048 [Drosera rotundifolia]
MESEGIFNSLYSPPDQPMIRNQHQHLRQDTTTKTQTQIDRGTAPIAKGIEIARSGGSGVKSQRRLLWKGEEKGARGGGGRVEIETGKGERLGGGDGGGERRKRKTRDEGRACEKAMGRKVSAYCLG